MAEGTGAIDRTLLIIGSFTVAGDGILDSSRKKENADGTWFFQEIIALSSKIKCKTGLTELGARVTRLQILPAVTQHNYQQDLAAMFANNRDTLMDVTHVAFTGLSPTTQDGRYARVILALCKQYCQNFKYCVSMYTSDTQRDESISLFHNTGPEPLALPEGLKWAELRYDIILGTSADHNGYKFEVLYALCLYAMLSKLHIEMDTTATVLFPEEVAYDTGHSFIDQSHAANIALHVLNDLEGPAKYHSAAVNIAAADESLKWRDIWPTICAGMNCQPGGSAPQNEASPTVDSARTLVRRNQFPWNLAFTNDSKPPKPRQHPWPSLSEEKFEACWSKLLQHRQDTNLDISFLRDNGYYGSRTVEDLQIALKRSIAAMRAYGLLPGEAGFDAEKERFQETLRAIERVASGAP